MTRDIKFDLPANVRQLYQPYTGPSGPDQVQRDKNTRALGEALQHFGVKVDYESARDDGPGLYVFVTNRSVCNHISYDRWGYVDDNETFDQAPLEAVLLKLVPHQRLVDSPQASADRLNYSAMNEGFLTLIRDMVKWYLDNHKIIGMDGDCCATDDDARQFLEASLPDWK